MLTNKKLSTAKILADLKIGVGGAFFPFSMHGKKYLPPFPKYR
jgi:hypothetical protein